MNKGKWSRLPINVSDWSEEDVRQTQEAHEIHLSFRLYSGKCDRLSVLAKLLALGEEFAEDICVQEHPTNDQINILIEATGPFGRPAPNSHHCGAQCAAFTAETD